MNIRVGAGTIITVAVLLGGVTALLTYRWAIDIKKTSKENWPSVVTAAVELKPHTKITRQMLQLTAVPRELIANDSFRNLDALEGRMVLKPVRAQEQVRAIDLLGDKMVPVLAFDIPPGMRAIAIEASEVAAVGTSVRPGNHVDVLATYHDPQSKQDTTKMILQNVTVLAVNKGQTDPSGKDGANSSMTLGVKPEQTELITAASRAGALRVTLRAQDDDHVVQTEGVTARDLGGGQMAIEEKKPAPPEPPVVAPPVTVPVKQKLPETPPQAPPPPPRPEITIFRGTRAETVSPK